MNEMIFCSDQEPRHRRWFNCIRMPFEYKYLISGEVELLAHYQDLVFKSPVRLPVLDGDANQLNAYVLGIRACEDENERMHSPLGIQFLATCGGGGDDITFRHYFPVYDDGAEVAVTLTAIHEWENGMEATLEGQMLGGTREIIFYDTRYALCKCFYKIGETYHFKLAGLAYRAEILKDTKVQMSPKATEMYCAQVGKRIKRDADGNVVPMSMETKDMVAFVSRGHECPDDHEFQSTIRCVGEINHRCDKHYVLRIACARGEDDAEIEIPLIVNPDLLGPRVWPKVGKCVRGILWMQGHCVVGSEVKKISGTHPAEGL